MGEKKRRRNVSAKRRSGTCDSLSPFAVPLGLQYFNQRLTVANVTSNDTSVSATANDYNYDSWMALLSQLPLLLFTLLNSFLYQWWVNTELLVAGIGPDDDDDDHNDGDDDRKEDDDDEGHVGDDDDDCDSGGR